ncbi:uncharacterized protein LOC121731914 [Aricia agestis]|uniref:uncharacterized protein LOC121731914 n=1 Tax=Aricia agestis TaxID=91739 RepID=UPI001C205A1D|nr:uncharacterized protein LOC121731914 [Aricia agestis]
MPGHASSPYWAAVDFESEEEEKSPASSHRVYVDPWDNEALGVSQRESDSSQDNMNSFAGEPVSASFYYVPTKTCDETPKVPRRSVVQEEVIEPVYGYSRRISRHAPNLQDNIPIYQKRIPERRPSMYIEEPIYAPHPILYESIYAPMPYIHPRHRVSMQHHPEYVANVYGPHRRHSRLADVYEQYAYEAVNPEYEDWARPAPKAAPDNFHLSRYGHLRIDYSCSWNSLDRIIRNQ